MLNALKWKNRETVLVERVQRKHKRLAIGWLLRGAITTAVAAVVVALFVFVFRFTLTDWDYTLRDVVALDVQPHTQVSLPTNGFIHVSDDMYGVSFDYNEMLNLDTHDYTDNGDDHGTYFVHLRLEQPGPRFQAMSCFTRSDDGFSNDELISSSTGIFDDIKITMGDATLDIGWVAGQRAAAQAFYREGLYGCIVTATGDGWSLISVLLTPPEQADTALAVWTQHLASWEVNP